MVLLAVLGWLALPALAMAHNWTTPGELSDKIRELWNTGLGGIGAALGAIGAALGGLPRRQRDREHDEESDGDDLPPEMFQRRKDDEESGGDDLPPELFRKRRPAEHSEED